MDYYILNADGEPERCHDPMAWAVVSTVFLGLDHRFIGPGPPILFETMIFGGPHDGYQARYATRSDALEGHARAIIYALTEPAPK